MPKVRFGDVVREVKHNIDRNNNPYESYVAGDHMDTADLTIHRRGCFATDDVGPAFVREFKKGQVLYGSRRTYLKKVAVADFDGVTANTTFVLETKNPDIFLQTLLPFVMLTDSFTEWSVKRSKGSTNPYVLFSDLADFEFELPDIEEQRRVSDVLWACFRLREHYEGLIQQCDALVQSQFVEEIQSLIDADATVPLDDLIDDDRPITYGILKPGTGFAGGIPVVKVKDMRDGIIDESDLLLTSPDIDQAYQRSKLRAGDLLISIRGSIGRMAEVPDSLQDANITQDTARLSVKPAYNRVYLRGVLESAPMQRDMEKNIRGVAVKGINIGYLRNLPIPMPGRDRQDALAQLYIQTDKSKLAIRQALESLEKSRSAIMTKVFG